MNIDERLNFVLLEGKVSAARSKAIRSLNKRAYNISNSFTDVGLKSEVIDATFENPVSVVEIQFGNNDVFKGSQIISVSIYDDDDYAVELPIALALQFNTENYVKMTDFRSMKHFLKKLYKNVKSKSKV